MLLTVVARFDYEKLYIEEVLQLGEPLHAFSIHDRIRKNFRNSNDFALDKVW